MPWIESHTVLLRHRKLKPLAFDLRLKPVYVLGHLHALWHVTLEQAEDGDLSHWTDEFIADSACYSGNPQEFVRMLQKHKWLDGRIIHDWLDYAGRYLEAKYRTSNPERLTAIKEKHSKAKSDFSPTLVRPPNQPNLPNQHNKSGKEPPAIVNKPVENEKVEKALKEVLKSGFNIYKLINKAKNQLKWGKEQKFPDEVVLGVCAAYHREKDKIKDPFPWFMVVLRKESEIYFASKNIQEHRIIKERGGLSLAQILSKAANIGEGK